MLLESLDRLAQGNPPRQSLGEGTLSCGCKRRVALGCARPNERSGLASAGRDSPAAVNSAAICSSDCPARALRNTSAINCISHCSISAYVTTGSGKLGRRPIPSFPDDADFARIRGRPLQHDLVDQDPEQFLLANIGQRPLVPQSAARSDRASSSWRRSSAVIGSASVPVPFAASASAW